MQENKIWALCFEEFSLGASKMAQQVKAIIACLTSLVTGVEALEPTEK